MFANAGLVEEAVEAVKRMQKLDVKKMNVHSIDALRKRSNVSDLAQVKQNILNEEAILKELVGELIALYKGIGTSIFVKFPDSWLREILDMANEHYRLLINPNSFNRVHHEIVQSLQGAHDSFFQKAAPKIGIMVMFGNNHEKSKDAAKVFNRASADFNALIDSMKKKNKSWEVDNLKLKEESGEVLELAKETLESAKEVSTNAAIDELAVFFTEQGEEHKTKQKHWLWTSIGVTAVLLLCLILFYNYSPDKWGTQIILQTAIKAFGFSLLLSVLIFCVKNYKAHGHNYIVNTHRVNSLKTYKKIVDGANSPDARDIIMANIAQHIFTPLDTGYVKGADSVGNPTVEIIRNVVKSADKEG